MNKHIQRMGYYSVAMLLMTCCAPAIAQSVGSRVLASPFSMENQWFPGTVVGKNGNAIVVKLDKRPDHDSEVYSVQEKWIKPGGGQPPADWNKVDGATAIFYGIATPDQLNQQAVANGNSVPQAGGGGGVAGGAGGVAAHTAVVPHPANTGGYPAHNPANTGHAPVANPHVMPNGMTRNDLERYGVETNRLGEKRYANTPWGRQLQQLHQQEQQNNGTANAGQTTAGNGAAPPDGGGALTVGSRVLASPFSDEKQWFPGTIVKALDGGKGGFIVRLDQKPGVNYQDVFQMNEKWVKPGGGAAPPNQGGIDPNLVTYYGLDPSLAANKPNNQAPAPKPGNTAGNQGGNQQINKNEKHVVGKGTPPDGLYEVNKIYTGGYMYLGTIEIRGNTYRGLSEEGPFHPYTMDGAGGITWTAGLVGIPDGWSVDKGNYNGLDHTGKHWIQVRFQGFRNAEEIADAIHK